MDGYFVKTLFLNAGMEAAILVIILPDLRCGTTRCHWVTVLDTHSYSNWHWTLVAILYLIDTRCWLLDTGSDASDAEIDTNDAENDASETEIDANDAENDTSETGSEKVMKNLKSRNALANVDFWG